MGVCGCGKTTIGKLISEQFNLPYFDADDFHSETNVNKLSNGIALNDTDRKPWLETLADNIKIWDKNKGAVLSCSALKESYRELLASKVDVMHWVVLQGNFDLILARLKSRQNHYMNPDLLQSQFDTLEIPKYGIHINIENTPEDIVATILSKLLQTRQKNISSGL